MEGPEYFELSSIIYRDAGLGSSKIPDCLFDDPPAKDKTLFIIDHHRLAGRDGTLAFIEGDVAGAIDTRIEAAGDVWVVLAYLRKAAEWRITSFGLRVELEIGGKETVGKEAVIWSDDDAVPVAIEGDDVERF